MTQTQLDQPKNALAVAGFALGLIASACALFIPQFFVAMFLAFVPAVLALIFGVIGISRANRLGGRGRALAIWAVVLGLAPSLVWLAAEIFTAALFGTGYSVL